LEDARLRRSIRFWFAVVLLLPALAWAESTTDSNEALPADNSIEYRTLPNGMRYWVRSTGRTSGKVSMWMRVGSGSINEDDDQRGLAHFLEHMAFNGGENFPAGTLIKRFEAAGLTFGAHQNATTSFRDTIYKLSMPSNPVMLDLGLLFFSDVAFRLTLDPKEVVRERGVVLAERTARDSASKRALTRQLVELAPDSRFTERFPIGDEQVIKTATAEKLRAYYQKWYRPDNTVLMVVGDVDAESLDEMVRKHFADWQPAGEPAPDRDPGIRPYGSDRAAVVVEPGLIAADVGIAALFPGRDIRTQQGYRQYLIERITIQLMNRRLRDQILEGGTPFSTASVTADSSLGITLSEARAKGAPREWESILRALTTELKRVREHGFGEAEFRFAVDVVRAELEKKRHDEDSRPFEHWLVAMDAAIEEHRHPISAVVEQSAASKLLPHISRAEVEAAVQERYAGAQRTFTVSLPKRNVATPTSQQVLAIVRAAEAEPVAKLPERVYLTQLMAKDPTPGKTIERRLDERLNVTSATLANGVRVHVRPLANGKGRTSVRILVAGGRVNETQENRGITEVAVLPFITPATDMMSSAQVQRLLTTKHVTVAGRDTAGALELDVEGQGPDLEDGMRLAHLLLTRARVEPAAFAAWQAQARSRQVNREGSVPEQLSDRVDALMTSNDPRFVGLTPKEVDRLTLADGQAWLNQLLKTAPIEVAIVGDMSHDQALALAEKYLGSLPARPLIKNAYARERALAVAPGPYQAQLKVDTATPKSAVYVGWRGPDWHDVRDWQVLDLASRAVSSRLFREVRERRGLVYTVRAQSSSNTVYRGNGRFRVAFAVDPSKADEAADVVEQVIADFVQTGPTAEELSTAREQAAAAFQSAMNTTGFWIDMLSDLDYMGGNLAWIGQYIDNIGGYTGEDVRAVLQKYIQPDRFIRVIGAPSTISSVSRGSQEPVAVN
jgi:zinc protease